PRLPLERDVSAQHPRRGREDVAAAGEREPVRPAPGDRDGRLPDDALRVRDGRRHLRDPVGAAGAPVQGGLAVLALPRLQRDRAVPDRAGPPQPRRRRRALAGAADRPAARRARPRRPRADDAPGLRRPAFGRAGRARLGRRLATARRHPDLRALLDRANDPLEAWAAPWGAVELQPALAVEEDRLAEALDAYLARLTAPPAADGGTYPFFHPRYAGQMLKPPHPVAVAAYAAAMRVNPNNHALDGGPPT